MSKAFLVMLAASIYAFCFAWIHYEEKKARREANMPRIISGKGWAIIDGEYMEY